jgi:hypothetical protein
LESAVEHRLEEIVQPAAAFRGWRTAKLCVLLSFDTSRPQVFALRRPQLPEQTALSLGERASGDCAFFSRRRTGEG